MTFELLNEIIKQNNIPETVTLMSDSAWECDATDMDGIYYNSESNTIVFTRGRERTVYRYNEDPKWKRLFMIE